MPSLSFTPDNLASVLAGKKTETRRLARDGERIDGGILWAQQRPPAPPSLIRVRRLFRIGQDYAVVPGRGKKAVARVLVTALRLEHLFYIGLNSVERECFGDTPAEYIAKFQALYHKPANWNPLLRVISFVLLPKNTRKTVIWLYFDESERLWACGPKNGKGTAFGANPAEAKREFRKNSPKHAKNPVKKRSCRVCGCTDDHACDPPCYWVAWNLCSGCAGKHNG